MGSRTERTALDGPPVRPNDTFDLVVIGCGPAGEKAAAQAAYFGKRVAVVERDKLGGACAHTGTLPSKGLRESALAMVRLKNLGLRGVTCALARDVRVDELLAHKEQVCATETQRIAANLNRHGIRLVVGEARLADPHTVVVERGEAAPVLLRAEVILLATGTRPHHPPDMPFEHELVWDSDEVVQMASVPESLLVYGAGVIGCEYASIFAALGVHVALMEPRDRILPFVDSEIVAELQKGFADMGITVHTEWKYDRVDVTDQGVSLWSGERCLRADRLLFAAGRTGNTAGLGLEELGVRVDKRGLVGVDACYWTGVGRIYAAGDVVGFPALASTGMDQGRVAMCHAFGFDYKRELGRWLPYGIYTIPECSLVGATEQELQGAGIPCEVGRAHYLDNARAQLVGADRGMVKLVFSPADRKLLGVHVVGERASELVHIGMTALQMGATIDVFIDAVYNYPTLSELFKYAAYDGLRRLAVGKTLAGAAAPEG